MEEELQERVSHVAASSAQMNMAEMEVSKTSVHLAEALRQVPLVSSTVHAPNPSQTAASVGACSPGH